MVRRVKSVTVEFEDGVVISAAIEGWWVERPNEETIKGDDGKRRRPRFRWTDFEIRWQGERTEIKNDE